MLFATLLSCNTGSKLVHICFYVFTGLPRRGPGLLVMMSPWTRRWPRKTRRPGLHRRGKGRRLKLLKRRKGRSCRGMYHYLALCAYSLGWCSDVLASFGVVPMLCQIWPQQKTSLANLSPDSQSSMGHLRRHSNQAKLCTACNCMQTPHAALANDVALMIGYSGSAHCLGRVCCFITI